MLYSEPNQYCYKITDENFPRRLMSGKAYKLAKRLGVTKCCYTGFDLIFEDWRASGKSTKKIVANPHPLQATVEHIIEKSKGGNNDISNIIPVCRFINSAMADVNVSEKVKMLKDIKIFVNNLDINLTDVQKAIEIMNMIRIWRKKNQKIDKNNSMTA